MVVIDSHVHVYLRKHYTENMIEGIADQYAIGLGLKREDIMKGALMQDMIDGNPEKLIKEMDGAGIDKSVVFTVDWGKGFVPGLRVGAEIDECNKFVLDAVKKYPDRLVGFIAVDPRRKNAVETVERGLKEWGMKGIKFYPPTGFYPSDDACTPVYRIALDYGVPVLSHTGPVSGPFYMKCTHPMYIDEAAGKFPELQIIMAHAGWGAWLDEVIAILITRPNVYADISAWGQTSHYYDINYLVMSLRRLVNTAHSRILFGSDWGWAKSVLSQKDWVKFIREYQVPDALKAIGIKNFTPKERSEILGENAKKLLKI
ncbi:MAG: amidohydrolase family protein [Promethearchaeati archaeon SRVP18_Atabeyarchaeia-1]